MVISDIYSRGYWGSGGGLFRIFNGGRGGGYLYVDIFIFILIGFIMCDGNNVEVGGNFKLCDSLF